jgi:hypothetical protein
MVQLQILCGKKAGLQFVSLRFPIQVGRSPQADLSLDDPGVFALHFEIRCHGRELICEAQPNALVNINGKPIQRAALRSGDVIGLGASRIAFALAPARQASLLPREWLTWIALAGLCLAQVALIYMLNR